MRLFFILYILIYSYKISAQELYINSEPASLIPKGTKVLRLTNSNIFLDGSNIMGSIGMLLLWHLLYLMVYQKK